ncbi:hypothetical protein Q7P37_004673 [Cladosporium fusiforme]
MKSRNHLTQPWPHQHPPPPKDLSTDQCILLAVHYASSADIPSLHTFTPSRPDALSSELVLRILLTYLPESLDPASYRSYISEVATRLYLDVDRDDVALDTSSVSVLDASAARKKVKKLHLREINPPCFPPHAPEDLLTRFLCHRAERIDEATGMLDLVVRLMEPFLGRNEYIRVWFLSVVVPVLRLNFEFYPEDPIVESLGDFCKLQGESGVDLLLSRVQKEPAAAGNVARDVKSLVGPWMYGHTDRKRRKIGSVREQEKGREEQELTEGVRKIALDGVSEKDKTGHDWEFVYRWMVHRAQTNFPLITLLVEDWDGPSDVNFGGYEKGEHRPYLDDDLLRKLELQYAQAAFASCYAAQSSSEETIRGAHSILARLAELLDFLPPPDLATSVDSLPRVEKHATVLDESQTLQDLLPERLLTPEHTLTTPRMETYMLLQMHVYTAYQLLGLGYTASLVDVAKLQFYGTADSQLSVLQKILRGLADTGKRDETDWTSCRAKLVWLWNWGIDPSDMAARQGAGVLGKIDKDDFETEMLKVFTETNRKSLIRLFPRLATHSISLPPPSSPLAAQTLTQLLFPAQDLDPEQNTDRTAGVPEESLSFPFVATEEQHALHRRFRMIEQIYINDKSALPLPKTEDILLEKTLELYDSASNGNKTRGNMKRANDIITTFRTHFPSSERFREVAALIAATHAHSFYSLTLQHGVPFQPVSIRVAHDPIGLISKVLEQNPKSYTQVDDLISIGRNLVSAGLPVAPSEGNIDEMDEATSNTEGLEGKRKDAERRITFMAIEAALREEDFETAYSYIVSRLTPSGADITGPNNASSKHIRNSSTSSVAAPLDDDVSWRAAFLAGRYRPATATPPTLRRLEQRTELLSLALLLAPTSALTDILSAWRRCEEEMTSLQLSQAQAEQEFDDLADRREAPSQLPGHFSMPGEQPQMLLGQKTREMGRMGASRGQEDAPVSMFDLTRSAARAFSRNAFPLGSGGSGHAQEETPPPRGSGESSRGLDASVDSLGSAGSGETEQQRIRRRDMVTNAVSGGLASGLGWVLGATPVDRQQQQQQQ